MTMTNESRAKLFAYALRRPRCALRRVERNELADFLAKKFPWLLRDVSQFKLADAVIDYFRIKALGTGNTVKIDDPYPIVKEPKVVD